LTNDPYKVYLLGDSDYVLAIVHDVDADKFWMVRQFRYGINRELTEFIGGGKAWNENPTSAIAREIEEELGYKPNLNYQLSDIKLLSQSCSYPAMSRSKTFLFYVPVRGKPI
jgi:8-oxo-dGTP pyrophosphatase MutT (NUDIX family)